MTSRSLPALKMLTSGPGLQDNCLVSNSTVPNLLGQIDLQQSFDCYFLEGFLSTLQDTMSLSLPFGVEKVLETYPVELIEALFLFSSFLLSLPFSLSFPSSHFYGAYTTCFVLHVGQVWRYKVNLTYSHTPEAFTGEGTILSFLSSAGFPFDDVPGECASG